MTEIKRLISSFLGEYKPYKAYWNYEDGCVLKGCIDLYHATGDEAYRAFVLNYLSSRVTAEGNIPNYEMRQYNIDSINSGKALYFALEETGEERYRKAIEFHMQRLREHPRCGCGNFWHKQLYPDQVWLDGLYMAQPFYMAYEMQFGRMEKVSDITAQFRQVRKHMFNADKGLNYHAWDTACQQPWADKETGLSPNFWLRSTGWYLMALIDCIDLCNQQLYEHWRALVDLFRESLKGLLQYQDQESGLFFQVIDHGNVQGNYLETSGSAMAAYSVLKGVRLGILDPERYLPVGKCIFEGLAREKVYQDGEARLHLKDICKVAGLGPGDKRDGSVAYYLSEPVVDDDSKGVGPFMMAWAEYLLAK